MATGGESGADGELGREAAGAASGIGESSGRAGTVGARAGVVAEAVAGGAIV